MVMTASDKPRLSVAGLVLVFALASAGWAATPARSCPDKKTKPETKTSKTTTLVVPNGSVHVAPKLFVAPQEPLIQTVRSFVAPNVEITQDRNSFRAHSRAKIFAPKRVVGPLGGISVAPAPLVTPAAVLWHSASDDDDKDMEKRLRRLERALKKLNDQINGMTEAARRGGPFGAGGAFGGAAPLDKAPDAPMAQLWISGGSGGGSFFNRRGSDETISRTYKLPKGKLDAVTKLMIRSDVPILVSPKSKGIEVQGSEAQHAIFKAFIDMIHPDGKSKKSRRRTSAASDAIRAYSDAAAKQWTAGVEQAEQLAALYAEQAAQATEILARAQAQQHSANASATEAYIKQYAEQLAIAEALVASQIAAKNIQIAEISHQAEALGDRADLLRDQAEKLADEAEELSRTDESREHVETIRQHIRALSKQAETLEKQSNRIERQADKVQRELEELESKAERAKSATKKSKKSKPKRR